MPEFFDGIGLTAEPDQPVEASDQPLRLLLVGEEHISAGESDEKQQSPTNRGQPGPDRGTGLLLDDGFGRSRRHVLPFECVRERARRLSPVTRISV